MGCKSSSAPQSERKKNSRVFKVILYPVLADNPEFANNLLLAIKEVIEYKFSQEVVVQNYIPKESSHIQSDLEMLNAKKGLLCKIDSLNLFFRQKIYFRCYVFSKDNHSSHIDISNILTRVREEVQNQQKNGGYVFFDVAIDLNSKENLEQAMTILIKDRKEKVFLPEHLFLKQENFLFVIKEKFSTISKKYLFE